MNLPGERGWVSKILRQGPMPRAEWQVFTVSVLGQDEGYTVKYNPLAEGVPEGKARGNS